MCTEVGAVSFGQGQAVPHICRLVGLEMKLRLGRSFETCALFRARSSRRHHETSGPKKSDASDSLAHGDVFGELIQFLAVGVALGFFSGEGFDAANVSTEPVFKLFDARGKSDEGVGQWILHIVRIGDEHPLPVAIDDVRRHSHHS